MTAGAAATFSVGLANDSGVGYQWLRGGVEIAGAMQPSFVLGSPSLLDAGATFAVRAANPAGTVTSRAARLDVVSPAFTLTAGVRDGTRQFEVDADGVGSSARFSATSAMAVDNEGNIYVGSYGSIRKVTPAGAVTTFVGAYGQPTRRDGTGAAAGVSIVSALVFDRARNVLLFLDAGAGTNDTGCTRDYAVFCTTAAGFIRELTLTGTVTTRTQLPAIRTCAGLALTPDAAVYTAGGNAPDLTFPALNFIPAAASAVYRVAGGSEAVLVAGNPDVQGHKDGASGQALFTRIQGMAADAKGNVYIADGRRLRRLSPDGIVTTVAGDPGLVGPLDGHGTAAAFTAINGIAVDGSGNVLVVDSTLIRRISPDGDVRTVARVMPPDPLMLQGAALGSSGLLHAGGMGYVGRFEPVPA